MLCTSLDRNYLPWGKLYCLSAALTNPNEKIYISSVNLSENEIKELKDCNMLVNITNHKIEVPKTIRYRQYMQCRISHVLLEVFEKFHNTNEICIVTDVDMLFRKSLNDLYALIQDNDILLKFDKEHLDMKEIQNGIIMFRCNQIAINLFLLFYNKMWDNGIINYRDDQRQLFKAWKEFRGVINFEEIPYDYVDGSFRNDSHIWSAHIGNRFNNYNKFLEELGLPKVDKCSNLSWIGKSDGRQEAN